MTPEAQLNTIPQCPFCLSLAPYCGSDQTNNYLDDALHNCLRRVKSDSAEEILACPQCGTYYYFREWTPGGSDDAMVTTYHQDFYDLTPYELYQKLYPYPEETEKNFLSNHASEICRGAINYLKDELSQKVHAVYHDQVIRHEVRAAEILQSAMEFFEQIPGELLVEMAGLLSLKAPEVRERISAILLTGLRQLSADKKNSSATLRAIAAQHGAIPGVVRALRSIE